MESRATFTQIAPLENVEVPSLDPRRDEYIRGLKRTTIEITGTWKWNPEPFIEFRVAVDDFVQTLHSLRRLLRGARKREARAAQRERMRQHKVRAKKLEEPFY